MSANTAPITFGKITLGSLIGCLLAASASFAVVGFVLDHVRSADAKTADAKSAEVASPSIWTVSGPFEARGERGVADYFLLEHPTLGRRQVRCEEIVTTPGGEVPHAVEVIGSKDWYEASYWPVLWKKK